MRRRDFIASVGASMGAVSAMVPATAAIASTQLHGADLNGVTRAIHAHFGDGFTVRTAHRAGGHITCLIENRGNYLAVASREGAEWTVRRASKM